MTPRSILIALAAVALLALTVSAYPGDLNGMPNGASYGITLGHPGGSTRKYTGIANGYYGAGKRWSQAFCQADADGDGQSNGLEMGDPCCVWTAGATPMFTTGLSNPNSAADTTTNAMPNCAAVAAEFQAFAQRTSAVRPMQFEVAQDKQPCDVCIAKLVAKDVPADDAAKICKLLQCVPAAAPTAAPKATTAAPQATTAAPKQAMAAALQVPCAKCIAELTEKFVPADDAAEICMKVLKCQPAAVPAAALKAMTAALNIPCDKCIAEGVEHGADADDAAFVCQKVLKCKPAAVPTAAPTAAPKATTAAPQATTAAPKQAMAAALKVPCDKCIAELTEKGADADDAAFVCQKVLKCQPAAAPVAMWSSFSNFATAAAGVPFGDCSAAGHLLQVTAVALNPNPPQKGQNVAISISGNLAAAIGSATAQLTVSLGNFQVLAQTFQLPGAAAGPVTQTVNIVVPGFAPSGTYTAKGVITSGGQQLACITASFNL